MGEQEKVDFIAKNHATEGLDLVVAMQEHATLSIQRPTGRNILTGNLADAGGLRLRVPHFQCASPAAG